MATISIPIIDTSTCSSYFEVRYKVAGAPAWIILEPNPIASPILINGVLPGETYDIEIVRACCNGKKSAAAKVTVDTDVNLTAPINVLVEFGNNIEQLVIRWEDVAGADSYEVKLSTSNTFPETDETMTVDTTFSPLIVNGVAPADIYFVKVKATADGHPDSDYSATVQITY